MIDLKPCPFCGSRIITLSPYTEKIRPGTFVKCEHCNTAWMQVSIWNARPIEDITAEQNTRLDDLNAIEEITDARFEYRNGDMTTPEMVRDAFQRLDAANDKVVAVTAEREDRHAHLASNSLISDIDSLRAQLAAARHDTDIVLAKLASVQEERDALELKTTALKPPCTE